MDERADEGCAGRRCAETSELDDGTQDHDRQFHDGKQRSGSYGGKMALWRGDGSGAGGCAAAECDSFNGRIRGRRGDSAARHAGYEASDPVCAVLSGTPLPGGRPAGFCKAGTDYL